MNLRFKRRLDYILGNILVAVNLTAARILGVLMRRDHSLVNKEPDAIVLIKILGLGSLIIASDTIHALKRRYPNSTLILVTGRGVKPGIEPLGLFDKIWIVDDASLLSLIKSSFSILSQCWKIRSLWVVDFEVYSKLSTIFSLWTCATNRFGFHLNPVRFRLSINTHHVYFNKFVHVDENYSELIKSMGVDEVKSYSFPAFPFKERYGNESYIAINNTCSDLSIERKLPSPLLKSVVTWICENTNYTIAMVGAPVDRSDNQAFIDVFVPEFSQRVLNKAGAFSFSEYYSFLYNECAFMMTIDSAPLHIAKRLYLPTVSIWGPTNPVNLSSQSDLHRQVYLAKHCSPCVHHTEILPCGGNNVCMKDISSDQIVNEIQLLMSYLSKKSDA